MEIQERITKIAEMTGADEASVRCMAKMVASQLEADDAAQLFIDADDDLRLDLTQAYAADAARKVKSIAISYHSKPDAKNAIDEYVYRLVRKEA